MIKLKQLLFEQTGTTTIKVGNTDVVGTTVNNTESKNDPWTYFVSNDGTYYTTKKSAPNAWKNLQTSLSAANLQKAISRIDKWKLATPATPAANATDGSVVTADGGENPVVDGGDGSVVPAVDGSVVNGGDGSAAKADVKTKTGSTITIDQIDTLPPTVGNNLKTGDLTNNILTFTDSEKRVIDLTGVENLELISNGQCKVAIETTVVLIEETDALTDKRNEAPTDTNTPEAVIDPTSINYILFKLNDYFIGIIKNKTGKYRAYYMTVK